jgi:N-acetylneuraminic acid mutarotase
MYVIGGAQANVRGNPTAPFTPGVPQLVLGTVEEYDPANNTWKSRATMPTPRNHLLAAAVNGKIYAICGRLGSAQITVADDTDVIEEYDPGKDQWRDDGRAPVRRSGMAGGAYNGKIYVAGGEYQDWEGAKAFWAVQSFDPATGTWENLPRMNLAHHGFASGFIGNVFHVAGGGFQSDGMPGVNTKTPAHETLVLGR